ncbi:3-deoxy-D-manno-octulosonic acid transferase [Leucothrix pacifica]|uniref:3-deoxy-D-manno-octulosonic acid transferase n=1 Tax=Leucothrix pacifica TaxID=1247513 RepID=A0A317CN23_9GAMM|nr:3-deoxy-D-manno-octulosonic acid transferase [Leucothrix pacifica]
MSVYRLLYSALWYLLCPFILLRLYLRSRNNPDYKLNWQQRLGYIHCAQAPRIWLHAVSVGETVAAKPLVESLIKQYPNHTLLVTNTTPTGSQTAKRLFGDLVEHCFFPYDLPHVITRFLNRAAPDMLIIMETEIWPNLLHHCGKKNIPVLIANARLSARSTKGYLKIRSLINDALLDVSTVACRSQQDADHFQQLGAKDKQLLVSGNIKFDVIQGAKNDTNHPLLQKDSDRKVLVAASTHQSEDEIILSLFTKLKKSYPNLLLILAPRHPERFNNVYQSCQETGFVTQRRSESLDMAQTCDIILGDSLGEMALWYCTADVVFIGGSLVETGGHNPLEATVYGVPVVAGPHVFNFTDVFDVLCEAKLAWVENDKTSLEARIKTLLDTSPQALEAFRLDATEVLKKHAGVTTRLILECDRLLPNTHN